MTNNINLFKGAKGDPYVIPQADLDQSLTDYINGHPTDFVKSVNGKSNVVVLNQGDIQSGPVSGTTANFTGALNAVSATLSGILMASAGIFSGKVQAQSLDLTNSGNTFDSGHIEASNAYLSGALSAASASFTGLNCISGLSTKNILATGTTTLIGNLIGSDASFSGTLSTNTLTLTGSNSKLQVQGGTIQATNGKISTLGSDILIVNQYICAPFYTTNIDITGITGNYNLDAAFISNGVVIFEDFGLRSRTDTLNITLPDSSQFVNGTYIDIVNVSFMNFTINNKTVISSELNSKVNYARIAVLTVGRINTWIQIGG